MPSKKGYLVPEIINPLTTRCVTFYLPDDVWWLAAFWGQMTALSNPYMWEGTDEERAQINEVWGGVLSTARQNFEAGECELTLEFRVTGGMVEYRPYPSAGWTTIGEACPCPTVVPAPQYNPEVADPAEQACNIAVGIIEWLMTKYNDTLDAITAATSTAGAFDAIFLIFPPAYLIADIVLDAIQEVITATVAISRAYDTVERREEMQQWLYCEMIATGEMTSENWSGLKEAFITGEFGTDSPGRAAMYAYLQTFEEEAILARARIESYGSGNCVAFNCGDEWEQEFDFTDGMHGWVFTLFSGSPIGTQVGTEGLVSVYLGEVSPDSSDFREMLQAEISFDASTITGVTWIGTHENVPATASEESRVYLYDGATQVESATSGTSGGWTGEAISIDRVRLRHQVAFGSDFSGDATKLVIVSCIISGTGVNPFI